MSDTRLFAKLDHGYFDNPKIGALVDDNLRAVAFHLRAILYCAQHRTDGVFPIKQVARLVGASYCGSQSGSVCDSHCGSLCDWCSCVHAGLFRPVDDRFGEVHDYLEHQQSAADVGKASAAGTKAANARWERERARREHANRIANRSADGSADCNAEKRREEKRKTLAHEAQGAHDSAAADAATRESEPKDEPPPLLTVEAEKPAPKTRPSSRDLDAAFATFWDTYPRKKSKAAGRTAYERAARKAGPAVIQAALEAQLPSLMAKDPTYRPYPATWLNAGSWDDEPDTPARAVPLAPSGPCSVDGAITDDAGTYTGWIHPTPVWRGGVVVHDPLGALGPPVVGGDHDWWAEQGALSAPESPAGSKQGEVPIRAVRAS